MRETYLLQAAWWLLGKKGIHNMESMEWEEKMSREVMTHINHFVSESTLQLLNPDMKSKVEEFYSDVWTPEWWCTQHRRRLAQRGQIDDTSEWLTSLACEHWIQVIEHWTCRISEHDGTGHGEEMQMQKDYWMTPISVQTKSIFNIQCSGHVRTARAS